MSRRAKGDRLAVWTRDRHAKAVNLGIGKRLVIILNLVNELKSRSFRVCL